jgi:hypothetical protein
MMPLRPITTTCAAGAVALRPASTVTRSRPRRSPGAGRKEATWPVRWSSRTVRDHVGRARPRRARLCGLVGRYDDPSAYDERAVRLAAMKSA